MNQDESIASDEEVVVECELEASPEKVWRALTIPELVSNWIDPRHGDDGDPTFEMIDTLPGSRVRYAWRGGEHERESTVTFEIGPRPGGNTWFRLTHSPARPVRAANGNSPPRALAA
jgi:uncharacterized protein YndB with AHSA1/START domain